MFQRYFKGEKKSEMRLVLLYSIEIQSTIEAIHLLLLPYKSANLHQLKTMKLRDRIKAWVSNETIIWSKFQEAHFYARHINFKWEFGGILTSSREQQEALECLDFL